MNRPSVSIFFNRFLKKTNHIKYFNPTLLAWFILNYEEK